jgi:hypothetical protein
VERFKFPVLNFESIGAFKIKVKKINSGRNILTDILYLNKEETTKTTTKTKTTD